MKKLNEKSLIAKLQQNIDLCNSLHTMAEIEEKNGEYEAAADDRKEATAILVVLNDFAELIGLKISGQDGDLHIVSDRQ